jgi:AraC-like DNA-binding protein
MLPIQTAIICILLLLRLRRRGESQLESKPIMLAVAAFAASALSWGAIVLYIAAPMLYAILGVPITWLFMGGNVLCYRFVYEITKTDTGEKFSLWHYGLPTLIALIYLVWSLFVPFDIQCFLVESKGEIVDDYEAYSWSLASKPLLFSLSLTIYAVFIIIRVRRFSRVVSNYSADEGRMSLSWLCKILYPLLGMAPLAVVQVLLTNQTFTSTPIIIIPLLFCIFRDVMLAHNILLDNFVVISTESCGEQHPEGAPCLSLAPITREDVRRLESYMRKTKPYLEPKLKITDMTTGLGTNRTTLSRLINRTYGMNFSRFINRYRLEELERLQADSKNADVSEFHLIAKAGFSDWRGYLRVKNREKI